MELTESQPNCFCSLPKNTRGSLQGDLQPGDRFRQPSFDNEIRSRELQSVFGSWTTPFERDRKPTVRRGVNRIKWILPWWCRYHSLTGRVRNPQNHFKRRKSIPRSRNLCYNEIATGWSELMPNITKIAKLLLVNGATTATPERSFSTARRLKNWLRSSMKQKRFNSLAILNTHKPFTDKIDFIKVGNCFVNSQDVRQNYFGKFIEEDL